MNKHILNTKIIKIINLNTYSILILYDRTCKKRHRLLLLYGLL